VARPGRWLVQVGAVGTVIETSERRFDRPLFALSHHPDDVVLPGQLADEPERPWRQNPDLRRIRPEPWLDTATWDRAVRR
jgi:hypothetical protein